MVSCSKHAQSFVASRHEVNLGLLNVLHQFDAKDQSMFNSVYYNMFHILLCD